MTHQEKKGSGAEKNAAERKRRTGRRGKGAEEKIRTECREKRRTRTNRNLGGIKIKKKKIPERNAKERKG